MIDIIEPGDPAYRSVRNVYSGTGSPAAVIRPHAPGQAAAALESARARPGPLSIRSGGHGISSLATNHGGTVIDLSRIDQVEPLGGTRVRVGAGAHWGHVARALEPLGLAISSGDSGDVGVGGLATSGGIGLLSRRHGLTIDRMLAAEILTADGQHRWVDAEHEPDLFWAIRGAGANVGIVTRFDFDASAVDRVAHAHLAYSAPIADLLPAWGEALEDAPREVSGFLYAGPGFAQANIVIDAGAGPAQRLLEPFTRLPGLQGMNAVMTSYAEVPLFSGAPHRGQQVLRARNGLVEHLDTEVARRLSDVLDSGADLLQIRSTGGAVHDVPPDATAYAHRHQNFDVAVMNAHPGERLDRAWEHARERMDGMYLSFASTHTPADLELAFPPPTLARLRAVKADWDPENVFDQNFSVG